MTKTTKKTEANKKAKVIKTLKAAGASILAAGLVASTAGYFIQKNNVAELGNQLAGVEAALNSSQANATSLENQTQILESKLGDLGLKLENVTKVSDLKDDEIQTLKDTVKELEDEKEAAIEAAEVKVFVGFDEEFGLGESIELSLNDNKLEKLADYEVEVDDEDISVEEFLKVNTYLNKEDSLSLMFDEGSVEYIVEYDADTGAEISEDNPLKIRLFGQEVEIVGIDNGELFLKATEDKFVTEGETLNGVEVLRISEDAILVQVGDERELIQEGDTVEVNDLKIHVGAILYIEGADDNIVNLRVGEELQKVYKTSGDDKYYDEDEMWKFTEIQEGRIVISLAEEVEEVSELVLPNDFAKISFDVDEVESQEIKVEKEDGVITKVSFELEDYDSTYVKLKDGVWEPEDDEEEIPFETGVELKDSDFKLVIDGAKILIVNEADAELVKVKADVVKIDGSDDFDNDEDFISVDGIVVKPTEDFIDDEDESLVIVVPEESVKATIRVE